MRFTPADLTDKMLAGMSEKDRKELGLKTSPERAAAYEAKMEKELQRECERYLMTNGYYPRTYDCIKSMRDLAVFHGWYIHLHKAKKNPLLLDLLILSTDSNEWLEVELKTKGGVVQEHQEILLSHYAAPIILCRSLAEFSEVLTEQGFIRQ